MRALKRIRKEEDGVVLATAIMILAITLLLGLAVLSKVQADSHQTSYESAGEVAFNVAESAVDAETLQLENNWPGSSSAKYPSTCNQGTTPTTGCPGTALAGSLSSTYAGIDYKTATWTIEVIDDTGTYGANYYSDTLATNPITWDSNGDNRLWIRAQATVRGHKRIVASQVVRQSEPVKLPEATIISGGVTTENNGNKVIINATDSAGSGITGQLNLRCSTSATPSNSNTCAGWDQSKGQLSPQSAYTTGYTDPETKYQTLSTYWLGQLKATAQANGTYFNGTCPTTYTGLVYVENAGACTITTGTYNSDSAPGALIFGDGTLEMNGNVTYYGIVYMADGQGTTPTSGPCTSAEQNKTITVHGGAAVYGAIFVDKCGTVDAGEAKFDVNFDTNAFNAFKVWATPALAKNTFRIIPAG